MISNKKSNFLTKAKNTTILFHVICTIEMRHLFRGFCDRKIQMYNFVKKQLEMNTTFLFYFESGVRE